MNKLVLTVLRVIPSLNHREHQSGFKNKPLFVVLVLSFFAEIQLIIFT